MLQKAPSQPKSIYLRGNIDMEQILTTLLKQDLPLIVVLILFMLFFMLSRIKFEFNLNKFLKERKEDKRERLKLQMQNTCDHINIQTLETAKGHTHQLESSCEFIVPSLYAVCGKCELVISKNRCESYTKEQDKRFQKDPKKYMINYEKGKEKLNKLYKKSGTF
jgi:hypothetical protein